MDWFTALLRRNSMDGGARPVELPKADTFVPWDAEPQTAQPVNLPMAQEPARYVNLPKAQLDKGTASAALMRLLARYL